MNLSSFIHLTGIPDITHWTRLEPRPRANDFLGSLRAELRDPMWLLTRQRQMGEFKGEDTGSPAYALVTQQHAPFKKWGYRTGLQLDAPVVEIDFDHRRPLEAQALGEPHTADLMTQVELGQVFFDLLDATLADEPSRHKIKNRFRDPQVALFAKLELTPPSVFDPQDRATSQFLLVAQAGAVNGFGIYEKAAQVQAPGGTFPTGLADDATEEDAIRRAFDRLILWVESTYGSMSRGKDSPSWDPRRLEYDLRLRAGDEGQASLVGMPDRDGTFGWPSFDLSEPTADPFTNAPAENRTQIPSHVRFRGMPAPRFWDFESGELSFAEVNVDTIELAKLVLIDVAMVYGIDWFTVPVDLPSGTIARIQNLMVRDVFGRDTTILRADDPRQLAGPGRWTIFSQAQPGSGLAGFSVLPPSAGRTVQTGPVLEEVRFARDEAANFVWAIERTTASPIGRPRSGTERDAAVDAGNPPPSPSGDVTSPLRYEIESKVPVNWIPFLPVKLLPDSAEPKIELEKAAVARPDPQDRTKVALVRSTAKILDPDKVKDANAEIPDPVADAPVQDAIVYRLPEEEVPRSGVRVQRLVYRSRWVDGSTHVWVARRKLVGAGETQSGLRFDAARPTQG